MLSANGIEGLIWDSFFVLPVSQFFKSEPMSAFRRRENKTCGYAEGTFSTKFLARASRGFAASH